MLQPDSISLGLGRSLILLKLISITILVLLVERIECHSNLLVGLTIFHYVVKCLLREEEQITEELFVGDMLKKLCVYLDDFQVVDSSLLNSLVHYIAEHANAYSCCCNH